MLEIEGLRAEYPGRPRVLDGIDLSFETGGYTLIAGPTGSGKSTLALALIGALEEATTASTAGRVLVEGRNIAEVPEAERGRLVAAVWQRPDVQLFRAGVRDEVQAALDHWLVPDAEGRERARAALALVGLDGIDERRDPMTLSGGEQQRLALAAALVQDAPLLVLDEATSALDRTASARFREALDAARSARPLTVVAVDHRPDAHIGRADRMLVLDDGGVVLDGPPETVFADPRAPALGLRLPSATTDALTAPRRAAAGPTALRLDGIGVRLHGAEILRGLHLDLPRGSVALLTGDNGAGKSTLLRLLAAEVRPSAGRVWPGAGRRVGAGIGAAPQRAADLLLTTTVADEVATAIAHGRPGRDAATRTQVAELLEAAALGALAEEHPLRLSGGQRQRLAVLLAVAGEAPLVLLDEPTSAQDRIGAERVRELVSAGTAERVTIIATHDPAAFASLATHRFELTNGRVRSVAA